MSKYNFITILFSNILNGQRREWAREYRTLIKQNEMLFEILQREWKCLLTVYFFGQAKLKHFIRKSDSIDFYSLSLELPASGVERGAYRMWFLNGKFVEKLFFDIFHVFAYIVGFALRDWNASFYLKDWIGQYNLV